MARGQASKLRRRGRKKQAENDVIDMFGTTDADDADAASDEDLPLPPKLASQQQQQQTEKDSTTIPDDLPKKKKKKSRIPPGAAAAGSSSSGGGGGGVGGIKTGPLILLILLTGTTLLPALIFASDYLSKYMPNAFGQVAFRLGIGSVPKRRVTSFYEKHAPEKLGDVNSILAKHYGQYPTLIKKLERKYQDYGYFLGWEQDEAPMTLALEKVKATYDVWIQQVWNRYAPQILKTAARNIRYNLTYLYKKLKRLWRKHVWPHVEPFLGVPKGVEKQKRQDAADARKARAAQGGRKRSGTRRKNTDFRDDEEEDYRDDES